MPWRNVFKPSLRRRRGSTFATVALFLAVAALAASVASGGAGSTCRQLARSTEHHGVSSPTRPRCVEESHAPRSSTPGRGYTKLIWSDEFNGKAGSPPDSSKWILDVGDYGSTEGNLQTYTASTANASLDGHGDLAIVARHQQRLAPSGKILDYTSARLDTQGRFSFRYGRIEARIELPPGRGLWPQFWMLGDDVGQIGWPASGEIDVMEEIGQKPRVAFGSIHGPKSGANGSYGIEHQVIPRASLASGFHTYGVIWRPASITWTLDGVAYASVTPRQLPSASAWRFKHRFHIIVNLAVGGTWPGPPSPRTPFPAVMRLDWIRVSR